MKPVHKLYQTNGLDVEVYDARFGEGEPLLDGDIAFYIDYAKRQTAKGGRVLELGCGTGRVTWQLAEAGIDVVGLDLSQMMLDVAQSKADQHSQQVANRIQWLRGDMVRFSLDEKFPMIFIPCRSFQCLTTPAAQERCLATIKEHLTDDGIVILDVFDPRFESTFNEWSQTMTYRSIVRHPQTGNLVHVEFGGRTSDLYNQTLQEYWQYTEVDAAGKALRTENTEMHMRWNTRQEMRYLFRFKGLEVVREFSDFKKAPPMYGREQIWIVRKNRS